MNYEFMGVMTFVIFISSLIIMFGFMLYDQKKQQEKQKKKS